jgi:DNA invertase Pin-like site-specific DNA recombinase
MTHAAIYARKSNDEKVKPDEFHSVELQRAAGLELAAARGWTVSNPAHVFSDDGVSGALFGDARPGLARLLNALSIRHVGSRVAAFR